MKVLFMEWKSLGQADLSEELEKRGWKIVYYPFPRETENTRLNEQLCEKLIRAIAADRFDFVFSFNYFPVVSLACNACKVKYVSWTFDSPFIQLYSNTIGFPYNYVFIFDRGTCEDLWNQGINTVYYLPMAAPVERYDTYMVSEEERDFYRTQISFIGSTYCEKKHRFYDRLGEISGYTKGYLDGCVQMQKRVYGEFLLEGALVPEIMEDMMKHCPLIMNQDGFERLEWVYAHYFLARQVTALERMEILDLLSRQWQVDLYTYEQTSELPRVRNRGTAEVMKEASMIYRCSKINLNISLRSILSGIPLRSFEIMGSGGFLLSNYQSDYEEYFQCGEDYVYYTDYEDLMQKAEYYLSHEKERQEIVENGYRKVKQRHTYKERLDTILETVYS